MKKILIPVILLLVLAGLVSATLELNPISDKIVDENETLTFDVVAGTYDGNGTLTFSRTPAKGTLTKTDDLTAEFEWKPSFLEAGVYNMIFSVTDGTQTDSENVTITVNDVNRAPTITGATLTVDSDEDSDTLTITASDPDTDDTLSYSMVAENASQADCSIVNTNQLKAERVGDWTGTAHCTVRVNDGEATAQADFTIKVEQESKLKIKKLKLILNDGTDDEDSETLDDGDSFKADVGDTITFDATIENLFTDEEDVEIRDITVEIEIEKFDQDDDDVSEESDEFDLNPEDDDTVTLDFGEVDKELDGTYDVTVTVKGEDEDNNDHEIVWTIEMEVEKKNDDITINQIDYPETLTCNQRSFVLEVNLENTGSDDQDEVIMIIESDDFDYNQRFLDLSIDEGDDLTKTMTVNVPSNLDSGTYILDILVYLDDNDYSDENEIDQETIMVTIPSCDETETPEEEEEEEEEEEGGIEVSTGTTGTGTGSFLGQPTEEKNGFFQGPLGITALVLLNVLIVVLIVVLLVRAFRK